MKISSEFTVGLITVIAIILLAAVTFQLQSFDFFSKQYRMYVNFSTTRGLESGAPVHVDGVPVGRVTQIKRLSGPLPVQVQFSVPKEIDLYENARIRISTSGMLGERFLDITPGSGVESRLVDAGHVFNGMSPVEIDQMLERTPEMMSDLGQTIAVIRDFISDDQNRLAVRESLQSMRVITAQIEDMLTTSGANINRMVANMEQTSSQVNDLTVTLNRLVSDLQRDLDKSRDVLAEQYSQTSTQVVSILENVESITDRLDEMTIVLDNTLRQSEPRLDEITKNMVQLSKDLGEVASALKSGQGTAGRLLLNPKPFDDMQMILERLRSVIDRGAQTVPSEIRYEPPRPVEPQPSAP